VPGIKAVVVYPMNALANSQYDDFARHLRGSGLKLALYTGDTFTNPQTALEAFRQVTGRDQPYDSEIISREEIRQAPPDILMTNYVMLELLLTRFEDRILFPPQHAGVLRFLVLDEVHTYTGQRGADVACLVRRLKQHTGTTGALRCIATSATVQSGDTCPTAGAGGEDAATLIADFASRLFGEPFSPQHVIGESYVPPWGAGDSDLSPAIQVTDELIAGFDGSLEGAIPLAEALLGRELAADEQTRAGLHPEAGNGLFGRNQVLLDAADDLVDQDLAVLGHQFVEFGHNALPHYACVLSYLLSTSRSNTMHRILQYGQWREVLSRFTATRLISESHVPPTWRCAWRC
jgi:hypothetical protein